MMRQMVAPLSPEKTLFQLQKADTTDRNHGCILFVTLLTNLPLGLQLPSCLPGCTSGSLSDFDVLPQKKHSNTLAKAQTLFINPHPLKVLPFSLPLETTFDIGQILSRIQNSEGDFNDLLIF